MTEINLVASIFIKKEESGEYPCILLEDSIGNSLIGYCTWNSAESLANRYMLDNEYGRVEKYKYFLTWKGNSNRTQLFKPKEILDETTILYS